MVEAERATQEELFAMIHGMWVHLATSFSVMCRDPGEWVDDEDSVKRAMLFAHTAEKCADLAMKWISK